MRPFGALALLQPVTALASPNPSREGVPSSSAGEGCTPSGCGTRPDSSFDFLRRVTSPAVLAPPGVNGASPAALGIPVAAPSPRTGPPDPAPPPAQVPGGRGRQRGVAIGIALQTLDRGAREGLQQKARETRCAQGTTPGRSFSGLLRPASSAPTAPSLPARFDQNLPSAMSDPSLPSASREVRRSAGGAV